jgi:hypothetical protein
VNVAVWLSAPSLALFVAAEFDRLDKAKSGELDVKVLTPSNLSVSRFVGKWWLYQPNLQIHSPCYFGTESFCAAALPSMDSAASKTTMVATIKRPFVRLSMMDSLAYLG